MGDHATNAHIWYTLEGLEFVLSVFSIPFLLEVGTYSLHVSIGGQQNVAVAL